MQQDLAPTFKRSPHNRENPYVMINNHLIRDEKLTPECRWLLIYLLSHKDDWEIKCSQIQNHLKGHKGYGRDSVRKIMKEAIEAGYICVEKYQDKGMSRIRYLVSEEPIYLNSNKVCHALDSRAPSFRAPQIRAVNKDHSSSLIDEAIKKEHTQEENKPSAEASGVCKNFIEIIKEINPKFKDPKLEKWEREFDCILKEDKRDLADLYAMIKWVLSNPFWKARCLSPSNLRKNYDTIYMQMHANKETEEAEYNRKYCILIKGKFPDRTKNLTLNSRYAMNLPAGKEVPFSLPRDTFKNAFLNMMGASNHEPNRQYGSGSEVEDTE